MDRSRGSQQLAIGTDIDVPLSLVREFATGEHAIRRWISFPHGDILPGAGVALLRALKALDGVKTANADQKAGVDIVRRAIQVPARQIVQNAGEDGSLVVGKLLENGNYNWGFNAATDEYQDLVKAGVIDPAKVVRTALQDAASVASLLITTEALVADKPKKTEANTTTAPPMDF
jgi:chaperonin GroEL